MTTLSRQNTLFVSEDWTRIYEALQNIDFRAYDFDNLTQAIMRYIQNNYSENYNDWIASSEFVMKVEILAWLSQNISFRMDLNTRENFLATAERRDSLIRLAQNIGYKVSRVTSASGILKIKSIKTTESIEDSDGDDLKNQTITWNDPRDTDWYEKFMLVMNAAMATRTQFGFPLAEYTDDGVTTQQYRLKSTFPTSGSYSFSATVDGSSLKFDIINAALDGDDDEDDEADGSYDEMSPTSDNAFNIFYKVDGEGYGSANTGFFLPFKQGALTYEDQTFSNAESVRLVELSASNINNDDFFVQQLDSDGTVTETWTQVDTVFGEGVSFNATYDTTSTVYEVDTLLNDEVRVRFGDGVFGEIPVGTFRFWYRVADTAAPVILPKNISNKKITVNYTGSDGDTYTLTLNYALMEQVTNGAETESSDDIRTRAGKVFYTQNRMITAQDYNNFYLKDTSILKVKTVNRTFSGQSRYSKLTDPTGMYDNISHLADDGRLYEDYTITRQDITADTDVISIDSILNNYLVPILEQDDKKILYLNAFEEYVFDDSVTYTWGLDSTSDGEAYGTIDSGDTPQVVGEDGTGYLQYVVTDAIIRLSGPKGTVVTVDQVTDDGTGTGGITLRAEVEDGTTIYSVRPPLRNSFTSDEISDITDRLEANKAFGIGWDEEDQEYYTINASDLDTDSDFSTDYQNDTTSSGLDASWIIRFEYTVGSPYDQWTIVDRGMSLYFESADQIDFIYTNTDSSVVDSDTGEALLDSIVVSKCNQSRDSLVRRGLATLADSTDDSDDSSVVDVITADGETLCYQTSEAPLDYTGLIVLVDGIYQCPYIDYTITADVTGYWICFTYLLDEGSNVTYYKNYGFYNAYPMCVELDWETGQDTYDLGTLTINEDNIVVFRDGIMQTYGNDYSFVTDSSGSLSIVFQDIATEVSEDDAAPKLHVFYFYNVDSVILRHSYFYGDGETTSFTISSGNQTDDTIMIAVDGVVQAKKDFEITSTSDSNTVITMLDSDSNAMAPTSGQTIHVVSVREPKAIVMGTWSTALSDIQDTKIINLSGIHNISTSGYNVIISIDGVIQSGPWSENPTWSVSGTDIVFSSLPSTDDESVSPQVSVIYYKGAIGTQESFVSDVLTALSYASANDDDDDSDEGGNSSTTTATAATLGTNDYLNVSSSLINFIGKDITFTPTGVLRHSDGYINTNGLAIAPVDSDSDGIYDDPYVFTELVLTNGTTDLVLWKAVEEYGYTVQMPINSTTSTIGTYGNSADGGIAEGDEYDSDTYSDGDVHYDTATDTWLEAVSSTGLWTATDDSSQYTKKIGRDDLIFTWTHYSPDSTRIDPSKSNIMNVYILTEGYDSEYRDWIDSGADSDDEPDAESSDALRLAYANYDQYKPLSDAIVYYPARYKPLFGSAAATELQATFKIIQASDSTITESDLKLKVLDAIDDYFAVDNWEFGESFYFTELVAYVHKELAPDLQSMVIVPANNNLAFGNMFQVRCESDQLFISAATTDNVEVVTTFTDSELRIGTLS